MTQRQLSDEMLIALFYENGNASEKGRRVHVSPRELQRGWTRLREMGRLPSERLSPAINHEDGRPSVETLRSEDMLLKRLQKYHCAPDYDVRHKEELSVVDAPQSPDCGASDETGGPD